MKGKYIFLFPLAFSALAQDDGAVCDNLLNHGISNVITQTTEFGYLSVVSDEYCSYSYSSMTKSKQRSFGAAVKKIPVSLKGKSNKSSTQHEEFCSNYKKLNTLNETLKYEAKTIYSKAIDAWRECVTLALGGTSIKPSISQDKRIVDFSISQNRGKANFTGVDTENISCTMDDKPISGSESIELGSNNRSLRCIRASEKINFNGSSVEYFPPANVKVKTNTGDYRVELFELIDQPMEVRLSRIEAQIATINKATRNNDSEIRRIGTGTHKTSQAINNPLMSGPDIYTCPKGSYVTAIHADRGVGGKFAVDGISGLVVECTRLHADKK